MILKIFLYLYGMLSKMLLKIDLIMILKNILNISNVWIMKNFKY